MILKIVHKNAKACGLINEAETTDQLIGIAEELTEREAVSSAI